ncbi:MAG: hypothetical protein ABW217_19575 [Polyangiaceae bacterium]
MDPVFHVRGRFYAGQLVSDDGSDWSASGMQAPHFSAAGYLFATEQDVFTAWRPGSTPISILRRAAAEGNLDLPSGASCTNHRCIVLGDQVYLVL